MNKFEIVATQAGEECVEIAQRFSKALRFGLFETQAGQPFNNFHRIKQEFNDLLGVLHYLDVEFGTCFDIGNVDWDAVQAKCNKIDEYLSYSKVLGCLTDEEQVKISAHNSAIDTVIENMALNSSQVEELKRLKL